MIYHPRIKYNTPDEDRSNSFIKYFANRVINNNKNFLCAVTGSTGSGKSWLTGSIGEMYRQMTGMPFNPKIHTLFSLNELLELINDQNMETKLPPCTFIHFDEPQVSANSRDWQSESNKILNTLTSTFRNMRLVIFFATPYLEFLDKQTRILFHSEIKVLGFDKTTNYTLCQPRLLEWIPSVQDFYRKRLIIEYPEKDKPINNWYFLQDWEVHRPSKEWIDVYEPKKLSFTQKLNAQLTSRVEKGTKKDNVQDRAKDFRVVMELFRQHGENYDLITNKVPHISPLTLEKWINMVKRQEKIKNSKEINPIGA